MKNPFIEFLTNKTLEDSQYLRTAFDYEEFIQNERYLDYQLLTLGSNKTVFDVIGNEKMIDHSLWPVTTSELARSYLCHIFEEQRPHNNTTKNMISRRVPWTKKLFGLLDINPPIYFHKPYSGELTYIDIKSAYFQLYQHVTLDMSFNPDTHDLGHGRITFLHTEELKKQKTIRNTMVGICRARSISQLSYGRSIMKSTYNRFLAPQLWGYLMYTLHAIARDLKQRFPIHYIHTDGYIIDHQNTDAVQEFLKTEWGLHTEIKAEGPGTVSALGTYKIGHKHAGSTTPVTGEPLNNLYSIKNLTPELITILKHFRTHILEHLEILNISTQTVAKTTKTAYNDERALAAFNESLLFGNDDERFFAKSAASALSYRFARRNTSPRCPSLNSRHVHQRTNHPAATTTGEPTT